MEMLAYLIFGIGWPVLVIGSIWLWRNEAVFNHTEKTFLNVGLTSFYLLGFVSTMYWLGVSWYLAVIPVFVLFIVLLAITIRTVYMATHHLEHTDREAHV
ncbi:MAG: hypothetical protein WBX11_09490 [Thiobacillaceae bacterium]